MICSEMFYGDKLRNLRENTGPNWHINATFRTYRRHKHGNTNKLHDSTNIEKTLRLKCNRIVKIDMDIDLTMVLEVWQQHLTKMNGVSWSVTSFPTNQAWDLFGKKHKILFVKKVNYIEGFNKHTDRSMVVKKWRKRSCQLYHNCMIGCDT